MSFDIHGNPLRRGHCEVHPHVHEEYPCSVCMSENRMRHQQEMQQCCDGNPSHCESAHYLGLAQEEIKSLKSERDALAAVVERQREALENLAALYDTDEGCRSVPEYIAARDALSLTPATAIRLHEAKFLEDLSQRINAGGRNRTIQLRDILCQHAARLRAGGEG